MKLKLFLDTNVMLDLLGERESFYEPIAKGNCQVLLTRNAKDFKESTLPLMTAAEYLASIGRK